MRRIGFGLGFGRLRLIKTTGLVLAGLGLVSLAGYLFVAGIGQDLYPEMVDPSYPEAGSQAEEFSQDLDYLRSYIEYDLSFDEVEKEEFLRRIDALSLRLEDLSATQFSLEVSKVVTASNNAHSSLLGYLAGSENHLPVRFSWFSEGLHILQTKNELAWLLGARIVTIDGRTPEQLLERLFPYFSESNSRMRYRSGLILSSPSILNALALAESEERLDLEITLANGDQASVTVEAMPRGSKVLLPFGRQVLDYQTNPAEADEWSHLMAGREPPLYLKEAKDLYGYSTTDDGKGLYVHLLAEDNQLGASSLSRTLGDALDHSKKHKLEYAIVDLRDNRGGSFFKTLKFVRSLPNAIKDHGTIYLITSPGTFSAGIMVAALLKHHGEGQVRIVGEPVGDSLVFWADGGMRYKLPNSAIKLRTWRARHDWANGCTDRSNCHWTAYLFGVGVGDLDVDLPVVPSFSDYSRDQDSVMQAILRDLG